MLLPYPLLFRIGHGLGRLAMRLLPRRVEIARRNLELCFPEMKRMNVESLLQRTFESVNGGNRNRNGMVLGLVAGKEMPTVQGYERMEKARRREKAWCW